MSIDRPRNGDHATATTLGIDENDLWIVAQAIQYNLVLVTNDGIAEIREVLPEVAPSMRPLENWTVDGTGTVA